MKRLILSLLVVGAPVHAFDWPWEDKPRENYSYCRGFAHSGLANVSEQGARRIQLWLDWNGATRTQFTSGELDEAEFEAGKARFGELLSANDTDALKDMIKNTCKLGTS